MSASQLLEKIPFIAFYVFLIGNVVTVGQWMFHGLRQTGGFPSSHEEMQRMGERVDKEAMSKLYRKYKKRMIMLWVGFIGAIILSSIVNSLIR